MSKGLELGSTARKRHGLACSPSVTCSTRSYKRGDLDGPLLSQSPLGGRARRGCAASRAHSTEEQAEQAQPGGRTSGPALAIFGFQGTWGGFSLALLPTHWSGPPTVAESGRQLGSGVEAPQWGDWNTVVQSLASRVRKTWIQILLDH